MVMRGSKLRAVRLIVDMSLLGGDEITLDATYLLFLNGMILGIIQRPMQFVQKYGRNHPSERGSPSRSSSGGKKPALTTPLSLDA